MPETDGPTCPTCLTLNPVGAPACIRCNGPLSGSTGGSPAAAPASPTDVPGLPPAQPAVGGPGGQGAPAGPGAPGAPGPPGVAGLTSAPSPTPAPRGLAVPPRGSPGGSRSAAATVQPPGYGMGTGADGPAGPPGPSPAEQRRIRRRIAVVGSIVVLLVLAGGGAALWLTRPRYLDASAVADRIGVELTARLREPVTVRCPASPRQRAGETFRCTAANGRGISQQVTVTVLDSAGRYRWTLGR